MVLCFIALPFGKTAWETFLMIYVEGHLQSMWYKVNLDLKLCKCSLCKLQELWRWKWGIKMLLCMKKQRGNFRFPFATSAVVSPGTLLTHALPAWEALRFSMGAGWEMTWSTVCDAGQGSGADLYFLQTSGENPEPNAAAAQTESPEQMRVSAIRRSPTPWCCSASLFLGLDHCESEIGLEKNGSVLWITVQRCTSRGDKDSVLDFMHPCAYHLEARFQKTLEIKGWREITSFIFRYIPGHVFPLHFNREWGPFCFLFFLFESTKCF